MEDVHVKATDSLPVERCLHEAEIDISETKDRYLTFITDGQLFGLSIAHVVQIMGMRKAVHRL